MPIGFNPSARQKNVEASATKELSRVFRPEFLNRLDRIVHFRPLSEETAAKIAHREVDLVLERSGIRRRRLFVDIDASVYPLLLREGYSKAFGARPLKRTVERLVLLPLARRIAEGNIPHGSLARLVVRNARVQVDLTPAEEPETAPAEAPPQPASLGSLRERVAEFVAQVGKLREQASPLSAQKSSLVARTAEAGFWDNPVEAHKVGAQIHRCDVVLDRLEQLWKSTRSLDEQVTRLGQNHRELAKLEDRLEELEARSAFAAGVMQCREPEMLGDAVVTLTCLATQGKPLHGVERLAKMYQKLAHRYRFDVEVLDDQPENGGPGDTVSLLIGGVGAYLLLAREAGQHHISKRRGGGKETKSVERDVIRVEVGLVPPGELPLKRQDVRADVRAVRDLPKRLLKQPKFEVDLLHMPSMVSLRVHAEGEEDELIERLLPLVWSKVSAVQKPRDEASAETPIVRRYRLGNAPLVKDLRTGRKTGRADDVFSGRLDLFLTPLEAT